MPRLWPISWAMVDATPMGFFRLWSYRERLRWLMPHPCPPHPPSPALRRLQAWPFLRPTALLRASMHPPGQAPAPVFQPAGAAQGQACGPGSSGLPTRRPANLVYSPRVLGAHGRHLGQSHGGPGELNPPANKSSARMRTLRNLPPSRVPLIPTQASQAPARRPPPTYVISCALSCWCRPTKFCVRHWRKLSSVVSGFELT